MVKMFTIEEAERSLHNVGRLLKRAQRVREKIGWLIESNDVSVEISNDDGFHLFVTEHIKCNKEFHRLYFQFYSLIEKLNETGAVVHDIDDGVVGFPFKSKEGLAYYSWILGEDKIRFWHSAEETFEERRPLIDVDELYG